MLVLLIYVQQTEISVQLPSWCNSLHIYIRVVPHFQKGYWGNMVMVSRVFKHSSTPPRTWQVVGCCVTQVVPGRLPGPPGN